MGGPGFGFRFGFTRAEAEICDLTQAVSHAYARGRFTTYTG